MEAWRGLLGLAARAGKVAAGADVVELAVLSGRAGVVLLAGDAAARTAERFEELCRHHLVPAAALAAEGRGVDRAALGRLVGRAPTAVVAVVDNGFAQTIIDSLRSGGYSVKNFLKAGEAAGTRSRRPAGK